MYTDMRDFEPEYTTEIDGLMIEIEKAGGGLVGQSYKGKWSYRITLDGEELESGNDVYSGIAKTHAEMARILADFIESSE